jgi:hypothetical protein
MTHVTTLTWKLTASVLFEELTTNYHSSYLTSASTDFKQFHISQETASWVLIYVPIASNTLDGLTK